MGNIGEKYSRNVERSWVHKKSDVKMKQKWKLSEKKIKFFGGVCRSIVKAGANFKIFRTVSVDIADRPKIQ